MKNRFFKKWKRGTISITPFALVLGTKHFGIEIMRVKTLAMGIPPVAHNGSLFSWSKSSSTNMGSILFFNWDRSKTFTELVRERNKKVIGRFYTELKGVGRNDNRNK